MAKGLAFFVCKSTLQMRVAEEDDVGVARQMEIHAGGGIVQHILIFIARRAVHEFNARQLFAPQRALRQAPQPIEMPGSSVVWVQRADIAATD